MANHDKDPRAEADKSSAERLKEAGGIIGKFARLSVNEAMEHSYRIGWGYQTDWGQGVDPNRVRGELISYGRRAVVTVGEPEEQYIALRFEDGVHVIARQVFEANDSFGVDAGNRAEISVFQSGETVTPVLHIANGGSQSEVRFNGESVDPEQPSEEFLTEWENLAFRVEPLTRTRTRRGIRAPIRAHTSSRT